jgi:hypothetical protein
LDATASTRVVLAGLPAGLKHCSVSVTPRAQYATAGGPKDPSAPITGGGGGGDGTRSSGDAAAAAGGGGGA